MGKKKRSGYINLGNEVGVESAIVQAATALDELSERVFKTGTTEEMFAVVDKWLELTAVAHAVLSGHTDLSSEGREHVELSSNIQIGFRASDEYLEELEIENGKKCTR